MQLSTHSNILLFFYKTPCKLNSTYHITIFIETPSSSQLNQIYDNSYNKHLTALNSFKHLKIITTNTLLLSTHSNTLQFLQQTPYSYQLIQIPYNSHNKHLQLSTHYNT